METNDNTADAVILTILPEENTAVFEALSKYGTGQLDPPQTGAPNLFDWQTFTVPSVHGPLKIALGAAGRAGNDTMQAAVSNGLQRFKPIALLIVGVAGGLPKDKDPMHAGDIVIGDAIWSVDRGKIKEKGLESRPVSKIGGLGLLPGMQNMAGRHPTWCEGLHNAQDQKPQIITGGIAASNYVITTMTHELMRAIKEKSGNTVRAVEMESWGAAASVDSYATQSGHNVQFGVVRGLSDIVRSPAPVEKKRGATSQVHNVSQANSAERDQWKQKAANNAAQFVVSWMVNAWPNAPRSKTVQKLPEIDRKQEQLTTLPDDALRIQHTKALLTRHLHRDHFGEIQNLHFAETGLPLEIDALFENEVNLSDRLKTAEACMQELSSFAKEFLAQLERQTATHTYNPKQKNMLRIRLVNAMQQAILLSAWQEAIPQQQMQQAHNPETMFELEVATWLSVSVLMREDLGNHLHANYPQGQPVNFTDGSRLDLSNGVEIGVLHKNDHGRAKNQVYKATKKFLFPAAPDFPNSPQQHQIDDLVGEVRLRKDNGKALLITVDGKNNPYSNDFVAWLNNELFIGVVSIVSGDGVFQIKEGHWKARLAELYKILAPLELKE